MPGKPFKRGRDQRRRKLTRDDKSKGGWITTFLYIHVSEGYQWDKAALKWAREEWTRRHVPS
jgi:hypothetical protein